jgi:DnaJ-class molecular chaperone
VRKRDYYDVLGVARDASPAAIRQAFRCLARRYSPDVNVTDQRAPGLFAEIAEAFRVLGDPATRALYDRLGHRAFEPARAGAAPPGDDLHATVEVDLPGALRGVQVVVEAGRQERCEACGGDRDGGCPACHGRGTVLRHARVPVVIPPGVDTGAQVRVRGEGHAAPGPGPRGDLVVVTRVHPHPFFTRRGDHLCCEVPITVPEAALGARIRIPTPDGPAVLTVPAGTQGGQVFRLRGRGCPRLDRDGRGDLLVATRVVIPRNADSTLEAVLRALERLLPGDPRAELWGGRSA